MMVALNKTKQDLKRLAIRDDAEFEFISGSFARGSQTRDPDLDVIFAEDTSKLYPSSLDEYFLPVSGLTPTGVDVLVYSPEGFK